jgi:cation transport regulator ChaC
VSELHWYFAYGSNLDPGTFLGRRRMRPSEARRAVLPEFELLFDLAVGPGERGVANVRECPGGRVCGVAWRIDDAQARHLDRTEGVHRGYYVRRPVSVRDDAGRALDAFTYASARGVAGRRPSRRYLGLLLLGARHHALPQEWIAWLRALPLAVDERDAGQPELPLARGR